MTCQVVDDSFSILIQFVLGFFALLSLWVKRITEKPRRKLKVFIYDVSKQVIGSLYAHGLNILIAVHVSRSENTSQFQDECMWYFVNFLVDVSIGMVLNWIFIKLLNHLARTKDYPFLISGNYDLDISTQRYCCFKCHRVYLFQLTVWLLTITFAKLILFYGVLLPFSETLGEMGTFLLEPIAKHEDAELVVVMILVPFTLNIIQFWIQDTFLKVTHQDKDRSRMRDIDVSPIGQDSHFYYSYQDSSPDQTQTQLHRQITKDLNQEANGVNGSEYATL